MPEQRCPCRATGSAASKKALRNKGRSDDRSDFREVVSSGNRPDRKRCVKANKRQSGEWEQIMGLIVQSTVIVTPHSQSYLFQSRINCRMPRCNCPQFLCNMCISFCHAEPSKTERFQNIPTEVKHLINPYQNSISPEVIVSPGEMENLYRHTYRSVNCTRLLLPAIRDTMAADSARVMCVCGEKLPLSSPPVRIPARYSR